ncbi:hypothetical protein KAR48_10755 [bacterium]|nr:hypothetical protein [bacterium]
MPIENEKKIDKAAMRKQWDEMKKSMFEAFIESTVGFDRNAKPACFGSGWIDEFCEGCTYFNACSG